MTARERAESVVDSQDAEGRCKRGKLIYAIEEAINAAVAKMEAVLRIFEDGANWEVYPGLRDQAEYVWRHDSDPRVLAQDACNGGTNESR